MGTLLIDDPAPTDDMLSFERISSGWATGTAWDQAWATNPATALVHSGELATAGANARVPDDPTLGLERIANNQPQPLLTPDQAEEQYGISGQLTFKNGDYAGGVRPKVAQLLNGWKQEEIRRADILSRATPGFLPAAARFGSQLGASILDPINIASSFIPVLGEARFASLARSIGLTGARLTRGALEGAVGQAAIEPLILLQARTEQSDYDMYDSLLNVTFGAMIGAGLHAGGGFLKDRIVGAPDLRPRPEAPPMSSDTQHMALSGAVAAVAEDRPVQVADLVRASSRRDALMAGTALGRAAPLEEPRFGGEPDSTAPRAPAEEAAAGRAAAVESRARELDPETFTAYDGLAQEKATYGRWIGELADTRAKNAEATVADLDRQIADTQAKIDSDPNQRKAKIYQKRLAELQVERESRVTAATARDTPDMRKVRGKLMAADQGMRDLAEKVSAAKRRADAEIPSGDNEASGLYEPTGPLDQAYDAPRADDGPQSFAQVWEQTRAQQATATPVRQSETAALSQADAKAKDFARPATIESESKALQEWSANDTDLVNQQREAGNLDEADEALLKNGDAVEQQHQNRAKAMEALGQCLIA
jgi:hypothetical protein